MPGPVPNRSEDLARPRERKGKDQVPVTQGVMRDVKWPRPDPEWHKIARDLYLACKASGQADFYQQSDVALLYSLCDDLSFVKNQGARRSAEMLKGIYAALTTLLVAEGDRRRVRIELQAPEEESEPAAVLAIADYKKDLGLS